MRNMSKLCLSALITLWVTLGWGACDSSDDPDRPETPSNDDDLQSHDDDDAPSQNAERINPSFLLEWTFKIDCLLCGEITQPEELEEAWEELIDPATIPTLVWSANAVNLEEETFELEGSLSPNILSDPPTPSQPIEWETVDFSANPYFSAEMKEGFDLFFYGERNRVEEARISGTFVKSGTGVKDVVFEAIFYPSVDSVFGMDPCVMMPFCAEGGIRLRVENLEVEWISAEEIVQPVDATALLGASYSLGCLAGGTVIEPANVFQIKGLVGPCHNEPDIIWSISKVDPAGRSFEMIGGMLGEDGRLETDSEIQMRFKPVDFSANPYFIAELEGPLTADPNGIVEIYTDAVFQGVFDPDLEAIREIEFRGTLETAPLAEALGTDPCQLIPDFCNKEGNIDLYVIDLMGARTFVVPPIKE